MVTPARHDEESEADLKRAELEAKMNAKFKVVYATKAIAEGEVVTQELLEEKELESSKIPDDYVQSPAACVGRRAKNFRRRDFDRRQPGRKTRHCQVILAFKVKSSCF